jgi:hypothetical protein
MLNSFFDDSGTHDDSDVVIVAGLFGTEGRLRGLDCEWKKLIDRPLEDLGRLKPPLKRFHMFDCQALRGEFAGWSRLEAEYFCNQLRKVIINSGVSAYGNACSRRDYEDLITGDTRAVLGTAEGFCIRNVFVRTLAWIQRNTFETEASFIFDDRPSSVRRDADAVFDAFRRETKDLSLVGIAFLSSYKILPLQAADMLAWELYQYAQSILTEGDKAQPSPELNHLYSGMAFYGQIATRGSLEKIADFWANSRLTN